MQNRDLKYLNVDRRNLNGCILEKKTRAVKKFYALNEFFKTD
jgi:hypothetical protein